MTTRKNPNAVALGRLGGSANTPAQNAARAANAKLGGRPPMMTIKVRGEPVELAARAAGKTPRATVHDGEADRPRQARQWGRGKNGRLYLLKPGVGWREVRPDETKLRPPAGL